MKRIDKKIVKFSYEFMDQPGYIKRKSLKSVFSLSDKALDKSINRLIKKGYLKINDSKTSHNGITYLLTDEGDEYYMYLSRSLWSIIKDHPIKASIIAFVLYFIDYLLKLYSYEVKSYITSLITSF